MLTPYRLVGGWNILIAFHVLRTTVVSSDLVVSAVHAGIPCQNNTVSYSNQLFYSLHHTVYFVFYDYGV